MQIIDYQSVQTISKSAQAIKNAKKRVHLMSERYKKCLNDI